jgi:hypothetical protein
MMTRKKHAYRALQLTRTQENRDRYNELAKRCSRLMKQYAFQKESKILTDGNPKTFYRFINSRLKTKPGIPDIIVDGATLTDDSSKATAFKVQFASVFVPAVNNVDVLTLSTVGNINVLSDFVVTRFLVEKSLRSFDNSSASGPDNIPAIFLKSFAKQIAIPLQKIFQSSFDSGVLPSGWKLATVIPIYKHKGKSSMPVNYRPVSLTSICVKAFEKVLNFFCVII